MFINKINSNNCSKFINILVIYGLLFTIGMSKGDPIAVGGSI